jgi:opacity protein-like surface antigen
VGLGCPQLLNLLMPKFAAVILLLFMCCTLHAQTWELGASAGGAGYMGDLNSTDPLKFSGAALGGYVKRNFNGYLSAKLSYTFGKIGAADSTSSNQQFRNRNLSFTSFIKELALIGEFNFMNYIPDVSHNRFTPYIYLGVGLVGFNPQTVYNGQVYDLQPLRTEQESKPYSKTALAIPYGAGIKYNFFQKWTIGADLGYRIAKTDYLDDVSGVYPNYPALPSDLSRALSDRSGERTGVYTGATGSQRGDGRPSDTYLFLQFTIAYTFVTQKCYFQ